MSSEKRLEKKTKQEEMEDVFIEKLHDFVHGEEKELVLFESSLKKTGKIRGNKRAVRADQAIWNVLSNRLSINLGGMPCSNDSSEVGRYVTQKEDIYVSFAASYFLGREGLKGLIFSFTRLIPKSDPDKAMLVSCKVKRPKENTTFYQRKKALRTTH